MITVFTVGNAWKSVPQNAKRFASDLELIKAYIRQNMKIVVSIAPSYLGVMNYRTPGQVVGALRKLGFDEVRETSEKSQHLSREVSETSCGKGRIKISLQLAAQV